jgi:hypothetical protein
MISGGRPAVNAMCSTARCPHLWRADAGGERAHGHPCAWAILAACKAKVGNHHPLPVILQQQVAGLEVAVQHGKWLALMKEQHAARHLCVGIFEVQ